MEFITITNYFRKLETTASRLEMTRILAELFQASSSEDIKPLCYLLQGRVAPLFEEIEFGIADKLMIRAIAKAYGVSDDVVSVQFKSSGDLGSAAETIATNHDLPKQFQTKRSKPVSLTEVFGWLTDITMMHGEGSQDNEIINLATMIAAVDATSVRYLVRIPLDKLRLGFSDMTMIDALSWMLTGDKSLHDDLENAYNVRPDLGYIASLLKTEGIQGVQKVHVKLGAPILAALCQRLPNATEMIKKMGEIVVEPKYDGVRTQIHFRRISKLRITRNDGQANDVNDTMHTHRSHLGQAEDSNNKKPLIRSFSRNLEPTTHMYPELHHIENQIDADEVILDSEAVGYNEETGELIPFQQTTTRKRKHEISLFSSEIPLRFYVFDILFKDGKNLMNTPLSERRTILESVISPGQILFLSPHIVTNSVDTLTAYHRKQIAQGLEGVVVKKLDSPYEPGRRGYTWVKFKESEGNVGKLTDTIDGVIMGYYLGEGKRSGFGIGAFLVGIRNGDSIVSLTKIGTGVSDDLWKTLEKQLRTQQKKEKPHEYKDVEKSLIPDFWVTPQIVVEIAADDITKSPIHGALYALRFPRLVHIREDKGIHNITTVDELLVMYNAQESIVRSQRS